MSVLGGVTALGPVGILVGPMLVAFIHALLVMVNKELRLLSGDVLETGYQEAASTVHPAVELQAEAAVSASAGPLGRLVSTPAEASGDGPPASGPLAKVREAARRRRRKR
jgi:hypothetical protein